MIPLLELPSELICVISEFLPIDDSFIFAATCKDIHAVTKPSIDYHKAMFRKCGKFMPTESHRAGYHVGELWDFTCDLISNPSLRRYVRELEFFRQPNFYDDRISMDDQLNAKTIRPPQHQVDLILAAIADSPFFPFKQYIEPLSGMIRPIDAQIRDGDCGPVTTLLVTLLTDLKTLKIDDSVNDVYIQHAFGVMALEPKYQALSKVTNVYLEHADTEDAIGDTWVAYACTLPAVRTLVARMASGNGGGIDTTVLSANPRLEKLEFSFSNMAKEAIQKILSLTPNLKEFRYEEGGMTVGPERNHSSQVAEAAISTTGDSIESICVQGDWWDYDSGDEDEENQRPYPDFSSCPHLRNLQILPSVMFPHGVDPDLEDLEEGSDDGDEPEIVTKSLHPDFSLDISTKLPASLETLTLFRDVEEHKEVIMTLLQSVSSRLMNLKKINLYNVKASPDGWDDLDNAAKQVGVTIQYGELGPYPDWIDVPWPRH